MSRPSHFTRFYHLHNSWWGSVWLTKNCYTNPFQVCFV
jgi:hypothetical protein